MRTIKFRGIAKPLLQNAISGKMVFGSLIENEVGDLFIITDTGDVRVDKDTVGQFTGLKDKNDNEIYEGDIIHVKGNTFDKDFGVVTFHENGYFYIDDSFGKYPRDCVKPIGDFFNSISRNDFFQGMKFYVIGNIHDNKDLVPGNNK